MKQLIIFGLCLISTIAIGQKKQTKISQQISANKDVIIDLDTRYVEIEVDTWNKNSVFVEAFMESDELSSEELSDLIKDWDVSVEGNGDRISITSTGNVFKGIRVDGYSDLLKDLEYSLADLPDVSEFVIIEDFAENFPKIELSELGELAELAEMPELPEFPELPELPEGLNSIEFEYERYKKDGDKYIEEWSKEYEENYGKAIQEKMKEWGKKFGDSEFQKQLNEWSKKYSKDFEEIYGKKWEKWGEKFGKVFSEKWEEKNAKIMEQRARIIEKRAKMEEERAKRMEERTEALAKRMEEREKRRNALIVKGYRSNSADANQNKARKVIKIKMPKKAKLKLNVKHGELKFSNVIYNPTGTISHSRLAANYIDGSHTSINVAYSPVYISNWNRGELNMKYVEDAQIKNVKRLIVNSNSSSLNIDNLNGNAIIDGSFGELKIAKFNESFNNLNLVLKNSEAILVLPKDVDYDLFFKGNRSKLNNKSVTQKSMSNGDSNAEKNIIINATYSKVTAN